jgi:hypothetical protein
MDKLPKICKISETKAKQSENTFRYGKKIAGKKTQIQA